MVRFGLIGCGRIGRMHAATIQASRSGSLSIVNDVMEASARALGDTYGADICTNVAEVFGSDKVDAVLIASSTATHAEYIEMAVDAGKPVFCEKPIDLDIARVKACRDKIAGRGVPIQIGFNRRFDPGHSALRQAIVAGEIGQTLQIIITSRDPFMPSQEYLEVAGGMIRDMSIHDFDLARFLLIDDEPTEVFAVAGALIDPSLKAMNEVDCAMITMKTAAGRQVVINNARQASYGYDQRLEVLGSDGMLQSCNRRPHELQRFNGKTTGAGEPYLNFFIERYKDAFELQLLSFIEAVETAAAPKVSFDDGLAALLLAEAAYESLKTGKSVAVG